MTGKPEKFDIRYADEYDDKDILDFVNADCACEYEPNNPYCYRKKGDRVSLDQVII